MNTPQSPLITFAQIVGPHPAASHPCWVLLTATDAHSIHNVPYRSLDKDPAQRAELVKIMGDWVVSHHVSAAAIARDRKRREALARQGLNDPTRRLPSDTNTQKGNWAEVFLAEYIVAAVNATLPVFRLRYNTNVDQSMKGDDVLAFDFASHPVRILVGESKFRSTPSKATVDELITALEKSHHGHIPASLQFVAERIFESGNLALGEKVADCNVLFAEGKLRLDYVGLFVSTKKVHDYVRDNAKTTIPGLALISFALSDPSGIVADSFAKAGEILK